MPRSRQERRLALQQVTDTPTTGAPVGDNGIETVEAAAQRTARDVDIDVPVAPWHAALPEALATGIGASFILGPVGLLLGAAQGILGKRLRQGELDAAAEEAALYGRVDDSLRSTLEIAMQQPMSGEDEQQLRTIDAQRVQLGDMASNHPDPAVRQKALERLSDLQVNLNAWYEDRESAAEAVIKEQAALRKERATQHRTALEKTGQTRLEIDTKYNTFLALFNELGADDPIVQNAYRDLSQTSLREADDGFVMQYVPGADGGPDKFTKDQMMRGSAAWYRGQTQALGVYQQARVAAAKNEGFEIDSRDGAINVMDLNVPQTGGNVGRADPNVPDAVRSPTQQLDDWMKGGGELFSPGAGKLNITRDGVHFGKGPTTRKRPTN